jgi:NAD(P)-dependent dehydrogenase (short-subunit alcohol dehydrogenase family)
VKEFKGKVAVITGSASGMGRAVAGRAAREGMRVVLADVEQKALDRAEGELKAEGAEVLAVRTDVSRPEALLELAKKTLDRFGGVHLLHNNAGVGGGSAIWETSLADWKWTLNVNLWGPIHGILAFLPIMLKQDTECHIVNTSSMGGLMSSPFVGGGYCTSKFGVIALSETLSHELRLMGAKIGVSVLCPGVVNTRIGQAKRNRPAELQNDPAWEQKMEALAHVKAMQEMTAQLNATGMEPTQVADLVFDAITEDRFYILTHPEWMMTMQTRAEEILNERQPTSMMVDMLFGGTLGG